MRKISPLLMFGLVFAGQLYALPACKQTQIFIKNNSNIDLHYIGANLNQDGGDNWQVGLPTDTMSKGTESSILLSSPNNVISKEDLQGYLYFTDDSNHKYTLTFDIPRKIKFSNPTLSFDGLNAHLITWNVKLINDPLCLAFSNETLLIN